MNRGRGGSGSPSGGGSLTSHETPGQRMPQPSGRLQTKWRANPGQEQSQPLRLQYAANSCGLNTATRPQVLQLARTLPPFLQMSSRSRGAWTTSGQRQGELVRVGGVASRAETM